MCTNGNLSAFRSGLLITNVPSRSSTFANHIPSGVAAPAVNLCTALSSADVVNVMTSCGLSKACGGVTDSTQRTARKLANVFKSDCTFA